MLPQPRYIYFSILEIGQDIGPVFPSDSCWPRAPSECGALAPSAGLHPRRGTAGPGSSWLLWRPPWSTGSPASTQTAASAPQTGSLHAHTPLPSLRLGEENERERVEKSSGQWTQLWQEITTMHGAKQLKVKRHVILGIHKSHLAEWHSNVIAKYNMRFTRFSTG